MITKKRLPDGRIIDENGMMVDDPDMLGLDGSEEMEEETPFNLDMIKELLNQGKGPSLSTYRSHLASMPQRGDFKSDWKTKLIAALAGASQGYQHGAGAGIKTVNDIKERPYNQALSDWTMKGSGLQKEASLESMSDRSHSGNLLRMLDINRKDQYGKSLLEQRDKKNEADLEVSLEKEDRLKDQDEITNFNNERRTRAIEKNADSNALRALRKPKGFKPQTPGQQARDESSMRELALKQTIAQFPEYGRLFKDGQPIPPKDEKDTIAYTNLLRTVNGKLAEMKKKAPQEQEDEEDEDQ